VNTEGFSQPAATDSGDESHRTQSQAGDVAQVLDAMHAALEGLRDQLSPVLGLETTNTILRAAHYNATRDFIVLENIPLFSEDTTVPDPERARQADVQQLVAGAEALFEAAITIITTLTGTILLEKLNPPIGEFRSRIGATRCPQ
jgi:hypothetical protein